MTVSDNEERIQELDNKFELLQHIVEKGEDTLGQVLDRMETLTRVVNSALDPDRRLVTHEDESGKYQRYGPDDWDIVLAVPGTRDRFQRGPGAARMAQVMVMEPTERSTNWGKVSLARGSHVVPYGLGEHWHNTYYMVPDKQRVGKISTGAAMTTLGTVLKDPAQKPVISLVGEVRKAVATAAVISYMENRYGRYVTVSESNDGHEIFELRGLIGDGADVKSSPELPVDGDAPDEE